MPLRAVNAGQTTAIQLVQMALYWLDALDGQRHDEAMIMPSLPDLATPDLPTLARPAAQRPWRRIAGSLAAIQLLMAPLLAVPGAVIPAQAFASEADMQRAQAKAIEAKAYFKQGLFLEAAEKFMEAFAISRKADTMYNAARAYEQAGSKRQALALFRQYLDLPDSSEDGKADARARIAKLEAEPAAADRTEPSKPAAEPVAEPVKTDPVGSGSGPSGPIPETPIVTKVTPTVGSRVDGLTVVLWASGSLLALVGAAAWSSGVTRAQEANAMDFSVLNAKARYNTAYDEARGGQVFGIVLTALGTAALGYGTYRFLRTPSRPVAVPLPPSKPVAAAPRLWLQPTTGTNGMTTWMGGLTWSL